MKNNRKPEFETAFSYGLSGGLSDGQLRKLHVTALRVLDEIGVELGNAALRDALAGQAGVRVDGMRVKLPPPLVDRLVDEHRRTRPVPMPPGDEFLVQVLAGYAFQVAELGSEKLRPMTTEECVRQARIVEGLRGRGVRGGAPGLPQDVPAHLREILAYKIALENNRDPGWPSFSGWESGRIMLDMAEAAGQGAGLSIFLLSPLMIEGSTVDMAVELIGRGSKLPLGLCNMPLIGATAPVHLPAAYVESTATMLAAFTAFKLLGAGIGVCPMLFPFDLRTGIVAYGTPAHIHAWLMSDQICRFYNNGNGQWCCTAFHTTSVFPDAHAVTTRTAFASVGALHGARRFGFGGWLSLDKVYSPEMLVIDTEIVDYLKHVVAPIPFTEETLGFEILKEVGPRGEFLTHDSTLAECRKQWSSGVFRNILVEQWESGSYKSMKNVIGEILKEAEAAADFRLSADVGRQIDRLYDAAKKQMV